MNPLKNIKLISAAVTILFMTGCAVVPQPIDVAENTVLVSFEEINNGIAIVGPSAQMPASNAGGKARWGGKIVSVVNKKDVSEIEVVFFPENKLGKPKTGMPSAGRFKAVVEGFVDPIVFEQGRLITVVGEVSDSTSGIIGEQEYIYPTLNAKGYYMWKETTDINVEIDSFAFSPFAYQSGFHGSFFNPWYDPWLRNRQRGRVRIERYNGHSQGATVNRRSPPPARVISTKTRTPSITPRQSIKPNSVPAQQR